MGRFFKLFFDFLLAFILGVLSLPFIILALILIFICSPTSPPVFIQERVGYKGKPFKIIKLRTMTNAKDENGELLPDEQRLKWWGKIIRATNIDELTQIWNILAFQMSFIGPRPLLKKEMVIMNEEEQKLRQSVRPGISGWEAVNEGKSSTRRQMAELDLFYVKNWSFGFDIKIFFKTIIKVFTFNRPDDSVRAPKIENEINSNGPDEEAGNTHE